MPGLQLCKRLASDDRVSTTQHLMSMPALASRRRRTQFGKTEAMGRWQVAGGRFRVADCVQVWMDDGCRSYFWKIGGTGLVFHVNRPVDCEPSVVAPRHGSFRRPEMRRWPLGRMLPSTEDEDWRSSNAYTMARSVRSRRCCVKSTTVYRSISGPEEYPTARDAPIDRGQVHALAEAVGVNGQP